MQYNATQTLDIWYTKKKQEHYKPVTNLIYWPVIGSSKNWNIIQLSQKSTPYDAFDEIHHVVLDVISDNMASLVKSGKYSAVNRTDTAKNGFTVIMFKSEAYKLEDNTAIYGQNITAGELFFKEKYLCFIQESTF